jgi:hypothetical protein
MEERAWVCPAGSEESDAVVVWEMESAFAVPEQAVRVAIRMVNERNVRIFFILFSKLECVGDNRVAAHRKGQDGQDAKQQ